MNFDDIKNELNNPTFKIDIATFLMNIHSTNLMNSYYLKSILKRQVEILELQRGKTGQELETSIELEIERLNQMFSEWLKEDLINVVNDSSPR
ncbi:hypothetical protein NU08_1618 [Flavobacterium anhuiense]|uniref:Uncharacterized protein n=1 Tax=Flavobacterium anhuiense TaxID=459526 RepID=A0A444W090_9FLAO|nr:hypothetical protein [Flavobacterium anhuiense]RYJ39310.1 hypothetical protein NU08_1618 [Flavobacterium anhuiense]